MEKFLKYFFRFSYYNLSIPYYLEWKPGLQISFQVNTKSSQYYRWLLRLLMKLLYTIICWASFFKLLPKYLDERHYDYIAFHSEWGMASLMTLTHQIPHLKASNQLVSFTGSVVELINNLEREHFGLNAFTASKRIRTQVLTFLLLYMFCGLLPVLYLIHLYFLEENWQFGSIFYKAIVFIFPGNQLIAICVGFIFDNWFIFYIWGTMFLALHINLSFMHTFKTTVALMMQMKRLRFGCKTNETRLQEQLKIYSKLRILTTVYNNIFGDIFVPGLKSVFSIMIGQSVFLTVKLIGKGEFVVTAFGLTGGICISVILIMFVGFTAMVHDYSVKFERYLRTREEYRGPLARRQIRAYKIAAVSCGGMYDIRRITCLTTFAFISNVCGSILISVNM